MRGGVRGGVFFCPAGAEESGGAAKEAMAAGEARPAGLSRVVRLTESAGDVILP
jgi:hypothetical protein